MMNLLEQFVLKHVQISLLRAELLHVQREAGTQEARVELNLSPRPVRPDSGDELPAYQVSARLSCRGGDDDDPQFVAEVGFEAIYQQVKGEPLDIAEFTSDHASLARQLYPLLQSELRMLLLRLGLEQVHLPFDLAGAVHSQEHESVLISPSLH